MSAPEPGPITEEAARLFAALEDWARTAGVTHASHLAGAVAGSVANGSADCRLCPFCTLIGALRTTRPETFDHLQQAVTALLAAMRSAVAASEHDWARRRSAPVERIDIG